MVIAIPYYQSFVIRSRVTEGLSSAAPAIKAVAETTMHTNALPVSQAATGYVSPQPTANVSSIVIGRRGRVTVAAAGGGTISFRPTLQANGDITWTCTSGTLATKYRPVNC